MVILPKVFKETFIIPSYKTRLYLRKMDVVESKISANIIEDSTVSSVETFLVTHAEIIERAMKKEKILIYDEIDFTHFYHACEKSEVILKFT